MRFIFSIINLVWVLLLAYTFVVEIESKQATLLIIGLSAVMHLGFATVLSELDKLRPPGEVDKIVYKLVDKDRLDT